MFGLPLSRYVADSPGPLVVTVGGPRLLMLASHSLMPPGYYLQVAGVYLVSVPASSLCVVPPKTESIPIKKKHWKKNLEHFTAYE